MSKSPPATCCPLASDGTEASANANNGASHLATRARGRKSGSWDVIDALRLLSSLERAQASEVLRIGLSRCDEPGAADDDLEILVEDEDVAELGEPKAVLGCIRYSLSRERRAAVARDQDDPAAHVRLTRQ